MGSSPAMPPSGANAYGQSQTCQASLSFRYRGASILAALCVYVLAYEIRLRAEAYLSYGLHTLLLFVYFGRGLAYLLETGCSPKV